MSRIDKRPWLEPDFVRRDCEPHRGRLLLLLGTFSLICGVPFWVLTFGSLIGALAWPLPGLLFARWYPPGLALAGIPVGLAVWRVARRDLVKMVLGHMDPEGKQQTRQAAVRARSGVVVSAGCFLLGLCGGWWSSILSFLLQ